MSKKVLGSRWPFYPPSSTIQKEGNQMDTRRFVIGTVVGAVVLLVFGYIIFDWLFASFYAANRGSATGVDRTEILYWAIVLGSLAYGALVMYAIGSRAGTLSVVNGAKVGAIVGFLLWFTANFFIYGYTNLSTLTRAIVDPLLELVHAGIAGAVVAAVLKKVPAPGPKPA
jgi:hypothetical protein